jgi:hypothetical protein
MLALYRHALTIRRTIPDLTSAGLEVLFADDPDLVIYRRSGVVVAMNMSDRRRRLPAGIVDGRRALLSSAAWDDDAALEPDAAVWLA